MIRAVSRVSDFRAAGLLESILGSSAVRLLGSRNSVDVGVAPLAVDEVVAPVGLGAEAMESSVRSFAEGQPRRGPFPWDGGGCLVATASAPGSTGMATQTWSSATNQLDRPVG